ncbi:DUF2807 domain-containing protein [Sphingomonas sp. LB-2]|uniref:DUF2807 domain-containing protein n=1 Tax=Sphingomonas caeni TaxID=2984949 RepID=UPI00222F3E48|nr:DUF2807 domain-containing protein [Sphingomonas caeni]MCW3846524.1 DUF2807 domain-containing protein [Sphingomonas caeni]
MRWLALVALFLLTASASPQEKTFIVSGFDRVRVDGPFTVEIVRGPTHASAEGDSKLLDRLDLHVDGTTLVVGAGAQGWNLARGEAAGSPRIILTTPALRGLLVNGGGQVKVEDMRGDRIDVAVSGAGTIDIAALQTDDLNLTLIGTGRIAAAGNARRARLRLNGAGQIDAAKLQAGDATIVSESSGDIGLGVRYTVRVFALGLGRVTIGGTPTCTISGPGPVECAGQIIRTR